MQDAFFFSNFSQDLVKNARIYVEYFLIMLLSCYVRVSE